MNVSQSPPAVSVVIPAYNAARYIRETLASVCAQSLSEIEVLVVDDCSTDDTAAVVQECALIEPRVRYLRTPNNFGGPAGPRNLGSRKARAPWVAFCDADDLWHREKLRTQLLCAEQTGAGLVCSQIESFHDGKQPHLLSRSLPLGMSGREIGLWPMLLKNRVATSSALCMRSLILDASGFNADRSMVAVEDYDMWLRLMTNFKAKLVRVENVLVAYRYLPGSLSASKWRQALKIMRVHRNIFSAKGWNAFFPLAAPVLILSYISSWLYLRSLVGRKV